MDPLNCAAFCRGCRRQSRETTKTFNCAETGGACARPRPSLSREHEDALDFFFAHGIRCVDIAPMGGVIGIDFSRLKDRAATVGVEIGPAELELLGVLEDAYVNGIREIRKARERTRKARREAAASAGMEIDEEDEDDDLEPDYDDVPPPVRD